MKKWFDIEAYEVESQHQHRIEPKQNSELDPKLDHEQATTSVVQLDDEVVERAHKSTRISRARMIKKYSKRHDI
jgi:hypothetical protein